MCAGGAAHAADGAASAAPGRDGGLHVGLPRAGALRVRVCINIHTFTKVQD